MIIIPRIARKNLTTSFFHVMVQGIEKEYIFNENKFKKKYLDLLIKYTKDQEIEIVAYCIMSNHAHILIYTEEISNLSKLMQKVNTIYAQYYNSVKKDRVGYVFRNRFESEPITSKRYLIQCIKYIHQNPVKANIVDNSEDYEFSSFRQYKNGQKKFDNMQVNDIITVNDKMIINQNSRCDSVIMDIEKDIHEITKNAIAEFLRETEHELPEIFCNRKVLKYLIKYLKEEKRIKYIEMMKELQITTGTMTNLKK